MADYIRVSNMQDNFGSHKRFYTMIRERTHATWVLGWCRAIMQYVHGKPPLSKQLRLIWLPQKEEGTNLLIMLEFKFQSLPRMEMLSLILNAFFVL
jgi:hypothetical protein